MNTRHRNRRDWIPSVGDKVHFHPIIGQAHDGKGAYRVRATEDSGYGVGTRCRVWLEGKTGFVCVEALSPADRHDQERQAVDAGAARTAPDATERLDEWAERTAAGMDAIGESHDARCLRSLLAWAQSADRTASKLLEEKQALEAAAGDLADNSEKLLEGINGLIRSFGGKR